MKSKLPILKKIVFSFFILTLLFFLFLPFLCDTYLLPKLISKLPFSSKELSVSRISPWKIRGTLRLLQENKVAVSIPKFELHYSPFALIQGQIDTLLVDGTTLQLSYSDKGFSIAGIDKKTAEPETNDKSGATVLPFTVKKIVVRNSHLAIQTETGVTDLVIDGLILMEAVPNAGKYILSSLTADITTGGNLNFTSSTKADFSQSDIRITTDIKMPNILDFTELQALEQMMIPAGSLDLTGTINVSKDTFKITNYTTTINIDKLRGSLRDFSLKQTIQDHPIQLIVNGNLDSFNYNLTNLSIERPQNIDIHTKGTVSLKTKTFKTTATLFPQKVNSTFELYAKGSFGPEALTTELQLTGDSFSPDSDTTIGPAKIHGDISYSGGVLNSKFTGNLGDIQLSSKQLTAKDVNWDVFLQFPLEESQTIQKSRLTIGSIDFQDEEIATLNADFLQIEKGIKYNAELTSKMDLTGKLLCSGTSQFNGNSTAQCTLAATSIDSTFLPSFVASPANTDFSGVISADGSFELRNGLPSGQLSVQLSDGQLTSGETNITDIETSLIFPHLPLIQSEPNQVATIGSIDSGKIHMDQGKLFYRIENKQQIFLEKARLSWCGGKIETGSLTLNSTIENLEATLYCDRLGFAELLGQFGIEDTEGEGSLNGRLPVAINNSGIIFDDGFLFSTPGNSGIVRFTNTSQLRQGMPGLGQTATLDYTIKALENFSYNWTKLTFNTEDKELLLAIQLDGKPAEPLPFGYKDGQIVATETGSGLQHPVRLDMNFRLPLQELFQYGKSLQSLMENM